MRILLGIKKSSAGPQNKPEKRSRSLLKSDAGRLGTFYFPIYTCVVLLICIDVYVLILNYAERR